MPAQQRQPSQHGAEQSIDELNRLSYEERNRDPKTSLRHAQEAHASAESMGYRKGFADALNNLGFYYLQATEHEKSLEVLVEALDVHESIGNEKGIADSHYNMATLQIRFGNFNLAVEELNKCLVIREKFNDKAGLALCYFQLTYIQDMFDHENEALEVAEKGLAIRRELNDRIGMAAMYNLMGRVYIKKKDYEGARRLLDQAINLRAPEDEIRGYFATIFTMVELEIACGRLAEAKALAQDGLSIASAAQEWFGIMRFNLVNGKVAMLLGDHENARRFYFETLRASEERKFKSINYEVCQLLSEFYDAQGDHKEALAYYKKYHTLKEEVLNNQSIERLKSIQLMSQIESSKKEAELERVKNVDLKNAFQVIEEKNKEILDSIKYASRIQRALITQEFYIDRSLKNLNP